ncbi:GNAT family N-acetyltransferase [Chitinophaga sp. XS-30]|uniref:GNAT family N-acetyltransferase n=1 Tax=Chitinophaga sp. XS-30 TaxID=2604421 RepID=UPI00143D1C21|nr:GNAT family N-acetyltransferase [Chitinophaga sp. XS-30]
MNATNDIRVLSWHPSLQPHFERLNKHWISKYFKLEQVDINVLEHPQEQIIDHGGDIIFVAADGEIAGTVAYKKLDDQTVEMTKMGVDERFQGRKLGWLLGTAIQQRAAEAGFTKMVLYSNRVLTPAITMYCKLGFEEQQLEKGGYERCDIKMEISLTPPPLASLAGNLRETVAQAAERLLHFSDIEAGLKPAPHKWSRKEILGHLIDSATNNYARFVRGQQAEYQELPSYTQDFWVEARQYQREDWKTLVSLWKSLNEHIASIFPLIPEAALGNICVIGANAPVTLQYIAEDYLRHLQHHLGQIFPVRTSY